MESAAEILAAQPPRDNLAGLAEWALKSELVAATGRSRDWFERAATAGKLKRRFEVDERASKLRVAYRVADVRKLLEGDQ